jgi:hypothetical protein
VGKTYEFDVSLFVCGDLHEAVAGPNGEACVNEVLLRVFFHGFRVVRGLEVFQSQCEIENVGIWINGS